MPESVPKLLTSNSFKIQIDGVEIPGFKRQSGLKTTNGQYTTYVSVSAHNGQPVTGVVPGAQNTSQVVTLTRPMPEKLEASLKTWNKDFVEQKESARKNASVHVMHGTQTAMSFDLKDAYLVDVGMDDLDAESSGVLENQLVIVCAEIQLGA